MNVVDYAQQTRDMIDATKDFLPWNIVRFNKVQSVKKKQKETQVSLSWSRPQPNHVGLVVAFVLDDLKTLVALNKVYPSMNIMKITEFVLRNVYKIPSRIRLRRITAPSELTDKEEAASELSVTIQQHHARNQFGLFVEKTKKVNADITCQQGSLRPSVKCVICESKLPNRWSGNYISWERTMMTQITHWMTGETHDAQRCDRSVVVCSGNAPASVQHLLKLTGYDRQVSSQHDYSSCATWQCSEVATLVHNSSEKAKTHTFVSYEWKRYWKTCTKKCRYDANTSDDCEDGSYR